MKHTRRTLMLMVAVVAGLAIAQGAERPYVVLVSIDGFRYDYAEKFHATNILAIRDAGATAPEMIPCFPSVTFPNHLSLITGLYPEHHGIVGNAFYDRARGETYTMAKSATDGTWYSGTPLWLLAEQQGVHAASMFWPSSDAAWRGFMLPLSFKYDGKVPNEQRVQQVMDWLRLPEKDRPHFITIYFSDVDHEAHNHLPDSPETVDAVNRIDAMIGRLRAGLAETKLPVNLIVVSDHGMQPLTAPPVDLTPFVDLSKVRVQIDGPNAWIYANTPEEIEPAFRKLKGKSKLFDAYRRGETPERWHFRENPRSGDIVLTVTEASLFTIHRPGVEWKAPTVVAEHGYDPYKMRTVHASFFAIGPNVKARGRVAAFENVNVYPFIARILGLTLPEKLDGSGKVLESLYVP